MTASCSRKAHIIYDIAVLTFLTLVISQKSFDIADFFDFEETFRNECSERNERRGAESGAKAGVPFRGGRSGGFRSPSLITLATFATKSLFKMKKISNIKGFL